MLSIKDWVKYVPVIGGIVISGISISGIDIGFMSEVGILFMFMSGIVIGVTPEVVPDGMSGVTIGLMSVVGIFFIFMSGIVIGVIPPIDISETVIGLIPDEIGFMLSIVIDISFIAGELPNLNGEGAMGKAGLKLMCPSNGAIPTL